MTSAEPPVNRRTTASAHDTDKDNAEQPATDAPQTTSSTASGGGNGSQTSPTPIRKGLKLGGISKTFANLRQKNDKTEQTSYDETDIKDTGEKNQFSEEQLLVQWLAMCNRMPQKMTGIASRMKNMTPKIVDFPNIELVVDNQILLDDITKIKGRIRNTLVISLKNSDIKIDFRLAKQEEIKPILTNRERFDELKNSNKTFKTLSDMLKLELT